MDVFTLITTPCKSFPPALDVNKCWFPSRQTSITTVWISKGKFLMDRPDLVLSFDSLICQSMVNVYLDRVMRIDLRGFEFIYF